jgi:hypothetical protein
VTASDVGWYHFPEKFPHDQSRLLSNRPEVACKVSRADSAPGFEPDEMRLVGEARFAELAGIADFTNVTRALDAFLARPAVVEGVRIPREFRERLRVEP